MKFRIKGQWMIVISLAVLVFLGASGVSYADRRGYVWTYEYITMPKGEAEIEYYLTTKIADFHKTSEKNTWEHQIEYEYGLTDYWDISVYQRFQQTNTKNDEKFEYTGTKIRTRYRLAEKGVNLLDSLIYLEYIRPDGSDESESIEGKLIVAKDFGRFNFAYNQILKAGINNNGEIEHEYATGINYEFSPVLKVGIESAGNLTQEKYYLGPTISWANEKYWAGLGVLRGLNNRSDDLRFRLIVGVPF